jgi:hypothetical protein
MPGQRWSDEKTVKTWNKVMNLINTLEGGQICNIASNIATPVQSLISFSSFNVSST